MGMHSNYGGVIFRQYPVSTILAIDSTRISFFGVVISHNTENLVSSDEKRVMKFPLEE
jgi:hypothetical protein